MKAEKNLLKKFYQYWLQKLEKNHLNRYYTSIHDLPVYNWWEIHEKGDFNLLLKKGKLTKHALQVFRNLKKEFHDTFGLHPQFETYMNKLIDLEIAKNKVAMGDKLEKTFVKILEKELQEIKGQQNEEDNNHFVASMEKYYGFPIETKQTSTFKFYDRVKAIENEVKQMKSKQA